jgi:hypothetical protein
MLGSTGGARAADVQNVRMRRFEIPDGGMSAEALLDCSTNPIDGAYR